MHILDNDFMLCLPGSTWKMENADPSAIYYPTTFSDEAEALAYGETVARQGSEEGIVLLTLRRFLLTLFGRLGREVIDRFLWGFYSLFRGRSRYIFMIDALHRFAIVLISAQSSAIILNSCSAISGLQRYPEI